MNLDRDMYVIFFDQGHGRALTKGIANRSVLAEFVNIPYGTLTNHFVRNKEDYHYYKKEKIMIIKVKGFIKGRQRVKKGRRPDSFNFKQ